MKKQIKNYLKIGFFLLGIAFTTTSCEKEDESQENQLFLLSQKQELKLEFIQKNFSLKNCKDDYFKSNLQIKWKEYSAFINIDSTISYEFSTSLNAKISSVNNKYHFYTQYKLQATIDNSNNVSYRILKYLSNNKQSLKKIDYNSLNDFSGTISHFNLDGKSLKIEAFNKGKFIQEFKNSSDKGNVSAIVPPIGPGTWVPMLVERWTDNYQNLLGGSLMFYTKSSNMTVTTEWLYIETGGSGYLNTTYHSHTDTPHSSGTYPDPDIDNHVEEILIDSTFANTKAECIFNKLGNSSTGFKNAIKKFDGAFPVAHLKMSVDNNLPDTINAMTSNSGTYTIEIKINGNTLPNRTVMGLARTLIHETIHAEMYRKLRSVNYSVSINDFPGIFYYYSTYKNWQHQQMASHYRTTIVDMLKEFDNSQHTDSFYNDLAWEGLQGTVAWNELSSIEKTRIINAINDYKNNGNKNCN